VRVFRERLGSAWFAALLGVGAAGLLLAGCGSTSGASEGGTPANVTPTTSAASEGGDTVGESSEPDTGRMSESEYNLFDTYHQDVVDESLQWTQGYQPCAVIGQSGDLAGFRDCVEEAWDGTEGALLLAYGYADETLADTAKKCRKALRKYRNVLDTYYQASVAAHDAANALDFDAMPVAFNKLPAAATKYVKASTNALTKCEPR
jgi:hypothetical protein